MATIGVHVFTWMGDARDLKSKKLCRKSHCHPESWSDVQRLSRSSGGIKIFRPNSRKRTRRTATQHNAE